MYFFTQTVAAKMVIMFCAFCRTQLGVCFVVVGSEVYIPLHSASTAQAVLLYMITRA